MSEKWIERRIITGMIVSDDYLMRISKVWNPDFARSGTVRLLAQWCLDFFAKYGKAPKKDIEGIFTTHMRNGLDEDSSADIKDILDGLSDDYERDTFNAEYLLDETLAFFSKRNLETHTEQIQGALNTGDVVEAERFAVSYNKIKALESTSTDPFSREAVAAAFKQAGQPLMRFGKAFGSMLDGQCVRDGFIAFMGPEKRGKSQYLLEFAMRGLMFDCNVVFFQAGDMSEAQQVKRICTWIARKSTDEKYCGELLIPTIDCLNNQNDTCREADRQSSCGLFLGGTFEDLPTEDLMEIYKDNNKYIPCKNESCPKRKGTYWYTYRPSVEPLMEHEAYRLIHKFRRRFRKQFKLVTYPNETLTTTEIRSLLDTWERTEMFVPDIIVIDYADILHADPDCSKYDFRNQENRKWQRLRRLSQERHCLVVTATQSDADSYKRELLTMSNFSETKTKFAHVTAMYGLNQTPREKSMGIMRINEIAVREGDFDSEHSVHVLQRLQIGRPYLSSFF